MLPALGCASQGSDGGRGRLRRAKRYLKIFTPHSELRTHGPMDSSLGRRHFRDWNSTLTTLTIAKTGKKHREARLFTADRGFETFARNEWRARARTHTRICGTSERVFERAVSRERIPRRRISVKMSRGKEDATRARARDDPRSNPPSRYVANRSRGRDASRHIERGGGPIGTVHDKVARRRPGAASASGRTSERSGLRAQAVCCALVRVAALSTCVNDRW